MGASNSSRAAYPSLNNMQTAKRSKRLTQGDDGMENRKAPKPSPRKQSEALRMNRRIGHIVKELDAEIDFWFKEMRLESLQYNGSIFPSLPANPQHNTSVHNTAFGATYGCGTVVSQTNGFPSMVSPSTARDNLEATGTTTTEGKSVCQANLKRCLSMKEALLSAQITGKSAKTDQVLQKGLSLVHDILSNRSNETVQEINHLAYEVDRKRAELKLGEEVRSYMIAKGTGTLSSSSRKSSPKFHSIAANDR